MSRDRIACPTQPVRSADSGEIESVAHARRTGHEHLDSDFTAMNINSGNGLQSNYLQTGTGNNQYIAYKQKFVRTTAATTRSKSVKTPSSRSAQKTIELLSSARKEIERKAHANGLRKTVNTSHYCGERCVCCGYTEVQERARRCCLSFSRRTLSRRKRLYTSSVKPTTRKPGVRFTFCEACCGNWRRNDQPLRSN